MFSGVWMEVGWADVLMRNWACAAHKGGDRERAEESGGVGEGSWGEVNGRKEAVFV